MEGVVARRIAARLRHVQEQAPRARISSPRRSTRKPCVLRPGTTTWDNLWAKLTLLDPGDRDTPADMLPRRPRTRAECARFPRPCPWVSCPFHRYLSVSKNGAIWINCPDTLPWEMTDSCVLDVVDAHGGGVTLEVAGELSDFTKERARQVERDGLAKLATSGLKQLYEELKEG